jgi:hypothetical protein
VPATAREEEDIEIICIQPLGFTGISGKMDSFRDDPAAALDPEFQEMPVGIPFCLDGKNILEKRGLVISLPLLIDLDLKVLDFRVGWLENAVLVQLRYIHERDIDNRTNINKVGMAHLVPASPLSLVKNNTGHVIPHINVEGPVVNRKTAVLLTSHKR